MNASEAAGKELGNHIRERLDNAPADAVIVFASAQYNYEALLDSLHAACAPRTLVGCSSSGEFANGHHGAGSACALAIRSPEMRFASGLGLNLSADRHAAATEITAAFNHDEFASYPHRAALLLTDALAGQAEDLVIKVNTLTGGTHRLFGGGAGDDGQFSQTHVFHGTRAYTNAAVALEMLSKNPIGVAASHGWVTARPPMRVTEATGNRLISLNATPAAEVLQQHAVHTGQQFDLRNPLPFFLHNILGINTGSGYKLRVPLAVNSDGSLLCAAEVPQGSEIAIMGTTAASAAGAAARAANLALEQIGTAKPKVALFFDCVATRLRTGQEFGTELQALRNTLGEVPFAGCNTHGQIARARRQGHAFHNCTATVCVIA